MMSTGRFLSLSVLSLALVTAAVVAAAATAASSRQSSGGVTCSMNSTSFVAAQAMVPNPAVVKLTCRIPAGSITLALTRQSGSKLHSEAWSSTSAVTYENAISELFKPHAVTPGNYRFTVTADAGSSSVAFTVLPSGTVPKAPRAGFWTGTGNVSFYVTPDQKHVIKLRWGYVAESTALPTSTQSCTATGTFTQKAPTAITGPAYARSFQLKGTFNTGAWFDTSTRAEGSSTAFSVPVPCASGTGTAKGLFVATWRNASQPK